MKYSKELLKELYHQLLNVRMSEEKLNEIYALGKVPGHIHSGVGEEAAYVCPIMTRNEGDWVKLTHRPVSAAAACGVSFDKIYAEIFGKATGTASGHSGGNHIAELDKGIMGTAGSLGVDTVVSIGAGISAKYLKNKKIVYSFYGDGTSSRGTTHEAMNWAGAWKLPVLFICDNNQFGISANIQNTCPVENCAGDRASAYGMPSKVVDGSDVIAVYEAAKELEDYVREGNGPAVLEVKTYRWRGHFEGDQTRYRDHSVAEYEIKNRDCIKIFEAYLLLNGVMTETEMELQRKEIAMELEKAVAFAQNSPEPDPESIYDGLYA